MVSMLGPKRIMTISVLLCLNMLVASLVYLYLYPKQETLERDVMIARGTVATLGGEIDKIKIELEDLREQQRIFEALHEQGFFSLQDRQQADELITEIQQQSHVISALASVNAGTIEANEYAQKAGYKILRTPIEIEIKAIEDIDIYKYLYLLRRRMPGYISFDNVHLERRGELTGVILRGIASGEKPPLSLATVSAVWRTMVPDDSVLNEQGTLR